ncbi:MAG TPA: phage tail protein [Anaerolineae bacterium]|nr:phage tail protein [Anaerolineae bacterium]HQH37973.1 phage tail protein [Anaerolineae bacterium]
MPFLRRDVDEKSLGRTPQGFGYDLLTYEFHLEVQGLLVGVFERLTGGEMEVTRIDHDIVYESGASTTLFIPGTTTFSPFTLERGFANYQELYNWFALASNGRIVEARRDGSIFMKRYGETYLQWDFKRAWPVKLSGFSFNQYLDLQKARVSITIAAELIEFVPVTVPSKEPADLTEYFNTLFPAP